MLRFWVVTLGAVLLGLIGVGLEVARVISNDNDGASRSVFVFSLCCAELSYSIGFYVPPKNVFTFASPQSLSVGVRHLSFSAAHSWALSHSSPLSCLYHLRLWFMLSIGPSECGMYDAPLATPPRLTITTAIPHPVKRACLGRRDPPGKLRGLTLPLYPFPS